MNANQQTLGGQTVANGKLIDTTEVARILGVSRRTVVNWRPQKIHLSYVKLGDDAVRYDAEEVLAFRERLLQNAEVTISKKFVRKTEKLLFSDTWVRGVTPPPEGEIRYQDEDQGKMWLIVKASGAKIFRVRKRVRGGEATDVILGRFPDIGVKVARSLARKVLEQMSQGMNVNAEKKKERLAVTIGDVMEMMLVEMESKVQLGEMSVKYVHERRQELTKGVWLAWSQKRFEQPKRGDLITWHQEQTLKHGIHQANRFLKFLGRTYQYAIEREHYGGQNIVRGVPLNRTQSRERFVQPNEWPALYAAIQESSLADFFLLAIYTGVRRGNLQAMRWDEIQWDRSSWQIAKTKNGDSLLVPLIPEALEILQKRKESSDSSEWVFPGRSATGHLMNPKNEWQAVLRDAELTERLTIHDLRRTLASWMAIEGVSLPIIGKALGHQSSSATQIYARLHGTPVREAMQKAVQALHQCSPSAES